MLVHKKIKLIVRNFIGKTVKFHKIEVNLCSKINSVIYHYHPELKPGGVLITLHINEFKIIIDAYCTNNEVRYGSTSYSVTLSSAIVIDIINVILPWDK